METTVMIKSHKLLLMSFLIIAITVLGMPQKARISNNGHIAIAYHQAHATGIPTVDIAALIQSLLDYIQQLSAYAEDLYQSAMAGNEYVQTLLKMEQMYREYAHYLNQIEGLIDYVDGEAWDDILAALEVDIPLNPLEWDKYDVDIYTDDGVIDVDQRITSAYNRIRELDEVYEDITAVFNEDEIRDHQQEIARRHYLRSRETTQQEYTAETFTLEQEALERQLEITKDVRRTNAVGEESDLRTMQTLALQNELSNNYNNNRNKILLKLFEMGNQESIQRKNKESYIYDMRLLDQKEIKEVDAYTADDGRTYSATF